MADDTTHPSKHDKAILLVRIMVGLIFIMAGYGKFSGGLAGVEAAFASWGIPAPSITVPLVATAELLGGLGILLGVLPRFSAAVLAIVMLTSTAMVQWPGLMGGPGGFEGSRLDLLLLFCNVAIAWTGAGRYNLPDMMGMAKLDFERRWLDKTT